jgi:glycosyltransferase involved in cell wall biosynthesis
MKKNIIVIKGQSQYNVLRIAADYMIESFRQKGYNVLELDLTVDGVLAEFKELVMNTPCELIFSFQALLFEQRLDNSVTSLLNSTKIPVFGHIVDHPVYHDFRLSSVNGDNITLGCIDKSHVEYVKKYYPNIENVVYLPHGGFKAETIISYENRTIDLFFPCSYSDPNEIMIQINNLPSVYSNMCKLFIQNMLDDPMLTLQDSLYFYLEKINFDYEIDDFKEIMNIVKIVDLYVRAITREKCIQCLLENNITVTVSGNGWSNFKTDYKDNLIILDSTGMDFTDVLNIMGNSKMVLNHISTHQHGTHERIFSSMICGAISLTHDFPIVNEEFTNNKDIVLFRDDQLQSLVDTIKYLINHESKAKEIAKQGYLIAKEHHTWLNNVDEILKVME